MDCYETRADALAAIPTDEYTVLGVRSCQDGNTIVFGYELGAKLYSYDDDGDKLLGVKNFSDGVREGCDAIVELGESTWCDEDDYCDLAISYDNGFYYDDGFSYEIRACAGDVAESLIAQCFDDPPAIIAGCEACACPACFPGLNTCALFGTDAGPPSSCGSLTTACLEDHCADECAAQLDALAAH